MTPERKTEIEQAIIRAMSGFGIDLSKSHQSMGLIGLREMRRDIPSDEFIRVLQSMEGVILDFDANPAEVRIPTRYFTHL
jgi:hypothetical protein